MMNLSTIFLEISVLLAVFTVSVFGMLPVLPVAILAGFLSSALMLWIW